ncbi:MAG: carboxypeptidase-like regulatory domain-containing protein [Planctomycetaceae bacterium]
MMTRRFCCALAITLSALLSGCGGESLPDLFIVKGKATHNGTAVADLNVTFQPADGSRGSSGGTDADGNFELVYKNDVRGVPAGDYTVFVTWTPSDPETQGKLSNPNFKRPAPYDTIHEKYGSAATSTLKVKIEANQENYELKLD